MIAFTSSIVNESTVAIGIAVLNAAGPSRYFGSILRPRFGFDLKRPVFRSTISLTAVIAKEVG